MSSPDDGGGDSRLTDLLDYYSVATSSWAMTPVLPRCRCSVDWEDEMSMIRGTILKVMLRGREMTDVCVLKPTFLEPIRPLLIPLQSRNRYA